MLSFDEFWELQPARVRRQFGAAKLREWFNAVDSNGNGLIGSVRTTGGPCQPRRASKPGTVS